MKPHKRNGKAAKRARQIAAMLRASNPHTPEVVRFGCSHRSTSANHPCWMAAS